MCTVFAVYALGKEDVTGYPELSPPVLKGRDSEEEPGVPYWHLVADSYAENFAQTVLDELEN